MFNNEIDEDGRPVCTVCNEAVAPNDTLPEDSLDRGTGAFTAGGGMVIIHKGCAKKVGL